MSMTLTQVRNLTRLYSGLSTTSMTTLNLDDFIAQNEVALALDMIETNPALAAKQEDIVWPANTPYQALNSTTLPLTLAAGEYVYKIVQLMSREGETRYLYSACSNMSELTGCGAVSERSEGYASSLRYLYDGSKLWLYPVPESTLDLEIAVVKVPVASTVAGTAILGQFTPAGQAFSEGVPIRAAFDLRASLGRDLTWINAKREEFETRLRGCARMLQLQEGDHVGNVRWESHHNV